MWFLPHPTGVENGTQRLPKARQMLSWWGASLTDADAWVLSLIEMHGLLQFLYVPCMESMRLQMILHKICIKKSVHSEYCDYLNMCLQKKPKTIVWHQEWWWLPVIPVSRGLGRSNELITAVKKCNVHMHTESSVTNCDKSPCHRALGAAQNHTISSSQVPLKDYRVIYIFSNHNMWIS